MVRSRFTHTSVLATDLEASVAFYEDVFGMERVPAPDFPGVDVAWLRCGDQTLHLFDRDVEAADYYHFGLHVDDFESVHRAAVERDLVSDFDDAEDLPTVYELPEPGQNILYDGSDNVVLVDHGKDHGEFSVVDANEPSPDNARVFQGLFLRGLLQESFPKSD